MSLRTITAITFFLAFATISVKAGSYTGCIIALPGQDGGVCVDCYKRKVLDNGKGCGPLDPPSDPCLVHHKYTIDNSNTCYLCKQGFSNSHPVSNTTHTSCVKGVIQDCIYEFKSAVGSPVCNACSGGKYAVLSDRTQRYSCQKVPNPLPNCLLGGSYYAPDKSISCYRCAEGYSASIATGRCERFSDPGCLTFIGKSCNECDFYAGYSMDQNGRCFKDATLRMFEN